MAQVVQAKCPHCQNVLRIPAEWLSQMMRCKHCQKTFQAKDKSAPASSTSVAAGAPTAMAATAKPAAAIEAPPKVAAPPKAPSNTPFGLDADEPNPSTQKIAKPRKSGMAGVLVLVGMFFFLFLVGVAGAGFVVYKIVANWDDAGTTKVAAKSKGEGNAPAKDKDKPGDGKSKDAGNPNRDGVPPPTTDDSKKNKDKKPPVVGTDGKNKDKKGSNPTFSTEPFPRRALLIAVENYLMFSKVEYGSGRDQGKGGYPGSSTGVLRDLLTRPPMRIPATQITELSDGIDLGSKTAQPHSTQKSVIETTIKDFVATSRAQDRVIILFAGHAASIEEKSYLVPIDGSRDPEKLIPLKWVYDQLASCKAQQKILILDVFRYSPGRGHELPSPGEGAEGMMPEAFDKDLQNPPSGVQVWCSCQKEQVSLELDRGSAFLQAFCNALQGDPEMKGFVNQSQPIPIEDLVPKVNGRLVELAKAEKKEQSSRLTGKGGDGVGWNKDEAAPPTLALKPPQAPGGEAAGAAQINNILDEIKLLPPFRATRAGDINLLRAQNLPTFSAKKLEGYKADDYQNVTELKKRFQSSKEEFSKQFPLRSVYFEVLEALEKSSKISMREVLPSPVNPKDKARFKDEQGPLAESMFHLERALAEVKNAEKMRDMETSKRWHANFDFARARLQSRLIYLYEYNYTLGQIRADNLPELQPGQSGWRVGITGAKINVTEKAAKDLAKANKGLWAKIKDDYPGTPWELLAEREDAIALGLAWRPKSD